MQKVILYSKDAKDNIRVWSIEEDLEGLLIKHGLFNGQLQEQEESISGGLAGRSYQEQLDSRMRSRINKQLDKGYVYSLDEANKMDRKTTAQGFKKPMLAQRLDKIKQDEIDKENAYLQFKYDGNRCCVLNNGEITPYSRNGKEINSLHEIVKELKDKIPYDVTIDGELYYHGMPLQTIRSLISKRQEATSNLTYIVYDIMVDLPYKKRLEMINNIVDSIGKVNIAPTIKWSGESLIKHRDKAIKFGYEGLILRHGNASYECDRRSKSLIKIKKFLDDEFLIVDVTESNDGWGILQCLANNGKRFSVSAPGGLVKKHHALIYKNEYIGKNMKIEYAGLTKDNIPFHPVAIELRNKAGE